MTGHADTRRFAEKYLDPGDRLGEILFGLIMVLTLTLTAGLTIGNEPDAARQLLVAAVGCNVAWGIIDGGMYIMDVLLERGRRSRLLSAIQHAPDETTAFQVIGRALDETLVGLTTRNERLRLYRDLRELATHVVPARVRVSKDDVMGAVASGWLVVMTTIPAALPFVVFDDARMALRVSNGLLLAGLFLVGYHWGRYGGVNRWGSGFVFLLVGVALVGVAIALGG